MPHCPPLRGRPYTQILDLHREFWQVQKGFVSFGDEEKSFAILTPYVNLLNFFPIILLIVLLIKLQTFKNVSNFTTQILLEKQSYKHYFIVNLSILVAS